MKNTFLAFIIFMICTSPAYAEFKSFKLETEQMEQLIKCSNPKISTIAGFPDLWSCVSPGAEVVKVFINAKQGNKDVENIKVMWNDWTKDTGYGVHTDKHIAEMWLTAIAEKYAPQQVDEVLSAYKGTSKKTIENSRFILTYSYYSGPAIDERLFVITAVD